MANEQYSKGGLFGAPSTTRVHSDANTIAELSGWRWTTSFTDYHLAGSQPATRMTYWLAQAASDYNDYPAEDAAEPSKVDNFQPVTPAQTAAIHDGVQSRLLLHPAHFRSRLVVRHRVPAPCPEHGANRVLDRRLPPGLADEGDPSAPGRPATRGSPATATS